MNLKILLKWCIVALVNRQTVTKCTIIPKTKYIKLFTR